MAVITSGGLLKSLVHKETKRYSCNAVTYMRNREVTIIDKFHCIERRPSL